MKNNWYPFHTEINNLVFELFFTCFMLLVLIFLSHYHTSFLTKLLEPYHSPVRSFVQYLKKHPHSTWSLMQFKQLSSIKPSMMFKYRSMQAMSSQKCQYCRIEKMHFTRNRKFFITYLNTTVISKHTTLSTLEKIKNPQKHELKVYK